MGILIAILVYLGVSIFLANQFFEVATAKGHNGKKYYWICFWLGLPGWLLVIALPDRETSQQTVPDELPEI